jgi:hypothetical protein
MKDDLRSIIDPDGVEFRLVDSADITDAMGEEMIAVFRSTFGRWPLIDPGVPVIDHLRWKTSGPFTRLGSMQARLDGRLAFASTTWATWMRIGGRRWLRFYYPDTAVDPAFQGRRIYSRVPEYRRRLVTERHDLSLHDRPASARQTKPLARRGQRRLANRVTRWFRVLRPLGFCSTRGRPELAPIALALAAAGALTARARRGPLRRSRLEPRDQHGFDQRFDALFEEAASSFDVLVERNQGYLSWRYGDRRAGPFVVRSIGSEERLLGYAVHRTAGSNTHLCDLLALPGRDDVVEALAADAIRAAATAGATGIECWLSSRHPYRRALRRQGFLNSRFDVGVEYHPIDATAEELRSLADPGARVHFLIGDTDLI